MKLNDIIRLFLAAFAGAASADAADKQAAIDANARANQALGALGDANTQLAAAWAALAADETKLANLPDLGEPLSADEQQKVTDLVNSLHQATPSPEATVPVIPAPETPAAPPAEVPATAAE